MKTIKYSFGILFSLIAMITISSCEESPTRSINSLEEETTDGTPKVYFSNENAQQIDLAKEAKSFDIIVGRTAAAGAEEYKVYATADSLANTVFDFPATVEFADEATEAVYTVTVKEGAELEYEVYHNINLAFDEAVTTPYGYASLAFKAGVPAPWSKWTETSGTYNYSLYLGGSFKIPVKYREHMIEKNKVQYLLCTTEIGAGSDIVVELDKSTGNCSVPAGHYFLDNTTYGPVFVSDVVNYPFNMKDDNGNIIERTYENFPCTYDAERGLFTLSLIYYVDASLGSAASGYFAYGEETVQLDGFYIPDYSLKMEYKGNYVDNNGVNNAIISTTKGVDVAKYLMTVVSADEDANATIQGMLTGTVPCDTLTEAGFYAYPIAESGKYRAIAITFDAEDNAVEASSAEFEFWVAGDSNPWESLGYAVYTDDIVLSLFGNSPMSYYVEVLENKEQPGLFRMVDPYGPEFPMYPYATSYKEGSYIEIDATDPEGVWIEGWQSTGCDIAENGLMEITSMAWYLANSQGATKEDAKEAGVCGVYADGVITFPTEGLLIALGSKAYYANTNGAFALDMSNLIETLPEGAAAARSAAARFNAEFNTNAKAMGKVTRFKKIDNPFLKLQEAEI